VKLKDIEVDEIVFLLRTLNKPKSTSLTKVIIENKIFVLESNMELLFG